MRIIFNDDCCEADQKNGFPVYMRKEFADAYVVYCKYCWEQLREKEIEEENA